MDDSYHIIGWCIMRVCIIVWTKDIVLSVQLLCWAFIIPETGILLLFNSFDELLSSQAFSPSAKFRLISSCYVIMKRIWNASNYILHELLADRSNFFAECGGKHHNLLSMWRASEDFLHVFTHIWKWYEKIIGLVVVINWRHTMMSWEKYQFEPISGSS